MVGVAAPDDAQASTLPPQDETFEKQICGNLGPEIRTPGESLGPAYSDLMAIALTNRSVMVKTI